jgi:hypothetical protein
METNKERRKNTDENIITFLVTSFENSWQKEIPTT